MSVGWIFVNFQLSFRRPSLGRQLEGNHHHTMLLDLSKTTMINMVRFQAVLDRLSKPKYNASIIICYGTIVHGIIWWMHMVFVNRCPKVTH